MSQAIRRSRPCQLLSQAMLASALAAAVFTAPPGRAQQAYTGGYAARPLINQPIDNSRLAILKGNTRPEAIAKNDRGLMPDSFPLDHMQLVLQRPPELEAELEQLIDEMQRPGSPAYHQWLTAQQFGERFGPAQEDVSRITGWLQSQGFTVDGVLPSGMAIVFSGNAGLVRDVFHTEIHSLDVKGESHFANMTDPEIPDALTPVVKGIHALHNFMPHSMMVKGPKPQFTVDDGGYYLFVGPADLATIYNLTPAFSHSIIGTGQTVVVIEDSDILNSSDVSTFRSLYDLDIPAYSGWSFTQTHPPSPPNPCIDPGENGAEGEAAIDAEWATAAAPNATIVLASCDDTPTVFGGLIALQNLLAETTPPKIVSISYGACEANDGATANQSYVDTYQQAATEGVSVFVAAGDYGGAFCDAHAEYAQNGLAVNGWASTPYNVAVGGTDFGDIYNYETTGVPYTDYWSLTNNSALGSALSYIPEVPWNSSCAGKLLDTVEGYSEPYGPSGFCMSPLGIDYWDTSNEGVWAGSGGNSTVSTQPNWQGADGVPTTPPTGNNASPNPRYLPDVSLFASFAPWAHKYVFCMTDTNQGGGNCSTTVPGEVVALSGGGTSFASPIMAGIQALINQAQGSDQGNPNPIYYALATTEYGTSASRSACNSSLGAGVASSCIFYDVTQGDTDVPCYYNLDTDLVNNCYGLSNGNLGALSVSNSTFEPAWEATTGWDYATGLGTVNVSNLINAWDGVPTTTVVTASTDSGPADNPVTFTATVTPSLGSLNGGTVAWSSNTACAASALSANQAICVTSSLPTGDDLVTATYTPTAFADASPYFGASTGSFYENIGGSQVPTIAWTPASTLLNGVTFAGEMTAAATCTSACATNGTFLYSASPGGVVTATTIMTTGAYTIAALFTPPPASGYSSASATAGLTVSGASVWIPGSSGLSELAGNGYPLHSTAYTSGDNKAVAIDRYGRVWSAGTRFTEPVTILNQLGAFENSLNSAAAGLSTPTAIAVDGNNNFFITNSGNNSISEFTLFDQAVSPGGSAGGYTDTSLSTPSALAIDLGGSVWVANKGNNSVTRFLGAAAPIAPLATADANNQIGARP